MRLQIVHRKAELLPTLCRRCACGSSEMQAMSESGHRHFACDYFFLGASAFFPASAFLPGAGAAAAGVAAASPSAAAFFFFLPSAVFGMRVFARPIGLWPETQRSSAIIFVMRSSRDITLRPRARRPFRFKLLSIVTTILRSLKKTLPSIHRSRLYTEIGGEKPIGSLFDAINIDNIGSHEPGNMILSRIRGECNSCRLMVNMGNGVSLGGTSLSHRRAWQLLLRVPPP